MGFEPTQLTLVVLESTPLDHSGKVSSECHGPSYYLKHAAHRNPEHLSYLYCEIIRARVLRIIYVQRANPSKHEFTPNRDLALVAAAAITPARA